MRILFSLVLLVPVAALCSADDSIDFNRDIRPILSENCFFCHGPDSDERQADLRLDVREEAIEYIESGDVLDRINSDDPDLVMPPPESKIALTKVQKDTLKSWIESGAAYARHWAFEPLPKEIEVPSSADADWCRDEIDFFVSAQHRSKNLSPSPLASPERWLRRATLDLTGLPPSPKQIAEFEKQLSANGDDAFASAVDSLLSSEAFGQHMATGWLDVARYADSYGYQSDKLNTQWPYRDWVVRAINDNLPYDQFLKWQLAGDLLPNPTRDQRLATAFNRIHRLNNEGGAVFEEWRLENVADRVHTFGTAVLGLTLECCRCHDHKYDPISMREYYSISAFFNSIDESGVYDRTQKVPCPSILLPTREQQAAMDAATKALKVAEENYQQEVRGAKERFFRWKQEYGSQPQKSMPDLKLALGFDRPFDNSIKEIYHPSQSDRSWTSMVPLEAVVDCEIPVLDSKLAMDRLKDKPAENRSRRLALKLDGERGVTTQGVEPFDRWSGFTVVMTVQSTQPTPHRSVLAHHTRGTDCGYNGWDLAIHDGRLDVRLGRVWPGNAISVRTLKPIPQDQWVQIATIYDGSSAASGIQIFFNGSRMKTETIRDELKKSANVKVDHGGEFVIGQRFRDRGFDGGLVDDARVYERALSIAELKHLASGKPIAPTREYYFSAIDEEVRQAANNLTAARKAFVMAEEAMVEVPIMRETDAPRDTHVLARGQYDSPTDDSTRVDRQTFAALPLAFPAEAPRDRLGLAAWVTDPNHPLTARVAINRIWGNFFSSGLVRTPENFGSQGELPTHPKLLDWLARDFVAQGWDVKRMCKKIVLSSTYRQDSRATPEALDKDPENLWLARGPAYRLSAEQIRDLALSASGLMDNTPGGPPVSPYQPGEDLWRESNGMSPAYKQSVGKSLYRRSLYSVWKRTAPLPDMMALDATTREVCTVKRSRTNTPLQSLVLLNDTQFVEAARATAQSVIQDGTVKQQIVAAFTRFAGRGPDEKELQVLAELYDSEHEHFAKHSEDADSLLDIGDSPLPETINRADLAAMTVVCQAILNLDATIWKR